MVELKWKKKPKDSVQEAWGEATKVKIRSIVQLLRDVVKRAAALLEAC